MYRLDAEDVLDFRVLYFGHQDRHVVDYISGVTGDRATTLWDVGANVGAISLPLLHMHPRLNVHAFEPSPSVLERLRHNVSLNPALAERIVVHGCALSDRSGQGEFYPSREEVNSGIGALERLNTTVDRPVVVDIWSAADLVHSGKAPAPDIVKLDVEGFEAEVLTGMLPLIAKVPHMVVVFEHLPDRQVERGRPLDTVVHVLRTAGLHIYTLDGKGRLRSFTEDDLQHNQDLVAIREA